MSLKDQDLPSVKLAKEIIKNPGSDYIISVIFSELNKDEIDRLQLLLKKKSVDSYFSYLNFDKKYVNDELDYLKFLLKSQK